LRSQKLDETNNRVTETLQLELLLHAYVVDEALRPEQLALGVLPQLAALEELLAAQARPSGSNVPAWLRGSIPWLFLSFNWGLRKVPVQISQMSITEHLFNDDLNPVHATVNLRLRVLRREEVLSIPEARVLFDKYRELRGGVAEFTD
jgi:hypothetical protein